MPVLRSQLSTADGLTEADIARLVALRQELRKDWEPADAEVVRLADYLRDMPVAAMGMGATMAWYALCLGSRTVASHALDRLAASGPLVGRRR